jgi:hypothetical protein
MVAIMTPSKLDTGEIAVNIAVQRWVAGLKRNIPR